MKPSVEPRLPAWWLEQALAAAREAGNAALIVQAETRMADLDSAQQD
jgi:hypothetical protein